MENPVSVNLDEREKLIYEIGKSDARAEAMHATLAQMAQQKDQMIARLAQLTPEEAKAEVVAMNADAPDASATQPE